MKTTMTPLKHLMPYARNPRKNDAVVDKMCAAIKEFGFRIPIVAKSDGTVVDGHLRLKAASALGLTEVPVVLADDLTDAQIKAFRLLANQSAQWAEWDEALLSLELQDLKNLDFDIDMIGFDAEDLAKMLDFPVNQSVNQVENCCKPMGQKEVDEVYTEEVDTDVHSRSVITQPGDLWILGNHRLLCGDSLLAGSYERVLDGKKAHITVTDPPYNVNYKADQIESDRSNTVLNDNLGDGFGAFLGTVCRHIVDHTEGAIYIAMAGSELHTLQHAFKQAGGHWSTFILWAKQHFALGRSDYHRQHETILYGWPEGAKRYWCGDRDQSDLWQYKMAFANKLHPTMKPVELIERAVTNSSRPGDTVFDAFGGSGTTLIACENTDRKCRMVELDPQYVDVIIRRWEQNTGKQAVLERTGQTFSDIAQHKQEA